MEYLGGDEVNSSTLAFTSVIITPFRLCEDFGAQVVGPVRDLPACVSHNLNSKLWVSITEIHGVCVVLVFLLPTNVGIRIFRSNVIEIIVFGSHSTTFDTSTHCCITHRCGNLY